MLAAGVIAVVSIGLCKLPGWDAARERELAVQAEYERIGNSPDLYNTDEEYRAAREDAHGIAQKAWRERLEYEEL